MEKNYTAVITQRTPRPRSKRLREMGIGSAAGATVLLGGIPRSYDDAAYLPLATFSDLFEKVITKEAVDEVRDADGNIVTEAQPAEYAIKAKYDLFSVGGISAYGFSGTGSGGGTASVDVQQILNEGVHIATINGVNIFAPASADVTPLFTTGTQIATINGVSIFAPKGGASSWAELTGTPPNVSIFPNNAGYITSAVLSAALSDYTTKVEFSNALNSYVNLTDFNTYKGVVTKAISDSAQGVKNWVTDKHYGRYLGINGNKLCLLDENNISRSEVIAPYAAYTEQVGATNSTSDVNIYGEVKLKNGSLAVAGNVNANFDISAGGNLSAGKSLTVTGESRFSGAVYLPGQYTFFGQNKGIYIEADFADGKAAYIGVHENFRGTNTIATVNLDGRMRIWQPMAVNQDPEDGISLRVGGMLKTDYFTASWIELYHATPYIDFHYGSSTADFTSRLIASEDGVVQIQSATADPALRIGNAYLRYDTVNNALYVTGQNGEQVHFYATGGIAVYSGLGSGITQLANLSLTGRLTAASVKANTYKIGENNDLYEESNGQLYFSLYDKFFIGGYDTYFDSDGGLFLQNGINIGSTDANHGITDLYADGSYVYITVNGKRYRLTPSSTTTV